MQSRNSSTMHVTDALLYPCQRTLRKTFQKIRFFFDHMQTPRQPRAICSAASGAGLCFTPTQARPRQLPECRIHAGCSCPAGAGSPFQVQQIIHHLECKTQMIAISTSRRQLLHPIAPASSRVRPPWEPSADRRSCARGCTPTFSRVGAGALQGNVQGLTCNHACHTRPPCDDLRRTKTA